MVADERGRCGHPGRAMAMKVTVQPWVNPAAYCRARGWVPGDLLAGREGTRLTTILIRYVGEDVLIAKRIREDGRNVECRESAWSLGCREWRRVRRATPSRGTENG